MKTPTKKELQELAVRALGEGATVRLRNLPELSVVRPAHYAFAETRRYYVGEQGDTPSAAARALAAALAALAEVRK